MRVVHPDRALDQATELAIIRARLVLNREAEPDGPLRAFASAPGQLDGRGRRRAFALWRSGRRFGPAAVRLLWRDVCWVHLFERVAEDKGQRERFFSSAPAVYGKLPVTARARLDERRQQRKGSREIGEYVLDVALDRPRRSVARSVR